MKAKMTTIPEPESTKPETNTNATDFHPKDETKAEPIPEWSKAVEEWGFMWDFHQYGLGAIYALISILTLVSLLKQLKGMERSNKKKVPKIVLNLLCLFGLSRCLFLCIDAYHWRRRSPIFVIKLLWGVAHPCIITAFTLVFIVMRNAFVLRQQFQNWYTTRNIAIATLPYFGFTLAAEITISFVPAFKGLTFICQLLYFTFAFILTVFYLIITILVWKKFRSIQTGNQWATHAQLANRGKRTHSILRTSIATVIGGTALCVMQTYAMFSVYGVFSGARFVSAWPWLAFQTIFRILEIYMALVLYCAVREKNVGTRGGGIAPTTAMVPSISLQNHSRQLAKRSQESKTQTGDED